MNVATIQEVARAVATPLQLAGGVDGPEQIELAFAAGATRVVVPLWAVAEDRDRLRPASRSPATGWPSAWTRDRSGSASSRGRARRHRAWRRSSASLADAGVRRLRALARRCDPGHRPCSRRWSDPCPRTSWLPAASATWPSWRPFVTRASSGVILGEALFSGTLDYAAAIAAAAAPTPWLRRVSKPRHSARRAERASREAPRGPPAGSHGRAGPPTMPCVAPRGRRCLARAPCDPASRSWPWSSACCSSEPWACPCSTATVARDRRRRRSPRRRG